MTLVDAVDTDPYQARGRLEVALEELERAHAERRDVTEPLARAVVLLGRYVLAVDSARLATQQR